MATPDVMTSANLSSPRVGSRTLNAILWAGAIAGTLDILCAITLTIVRGGSPIRMLQGIASGLLRGSAYEGGLLTAGLGLALHFFIATTATTVYVLASQRWPVLRERAILYGAIYGVAVYAFMHYVVITLTFGRVPPISWIMIGIHVFAVGLPIALVARRVLGPR